MTTSQIPPQAVPSERPARWCETCGQPFTSPPDHPDEPECPPCVSTWASSVELSEP